jgi:response regulator RpfG family c-di-GMP phosphodiesterase
MQMNKTILAFEDDPQVRQLLCSFLRRLGYEARTASDGATALGLARTAAPDLVVLDVDLPDGSGFDLCRAIKSRPDLASLPISMAGVPGSPRGLGPGVQGSPPCAGHGCFWGVLGNRDTFGGVTNLGP